MVAEGCIHGRFQPFHNEHLEAALAALDHCSFLWIGLADPFPAELSVDGPGLRLARIANPLTYYERQFMITRTLVADGMPPERFSFTPFPIRTPEFLPQFLDLEITCFVAINGERNRQKIAVLEELGYPVEIIWERARGIEADAIRSLLMDNDDSWRDLVPSSVASYLDELDLPARLRAMHASG